ncbi:MAG: hypothetical protein Q7R47_03170, partial [Candidatus Diapherotrites archaeon]|nr:hypothetical protein [Candidatus Diapherotrites archaeon]
VFPSFLLLSILIVAGVALVALNAGTALVPTDHVFVNVVVENRLGEKVPNAPLSLVIIGTTTRTTTNRATNSDGFAVFEVPKNSSGILSLSVDGFKPIDENITVTDTNVARRLSLEEIPQAQTRVIQFADASGRAITDTPITVKFRCSNTDVSLTPDSYSSDSRGQIRITAPPDCGTLQATVMSPAKFMIQPFSVDQAMQIVKLQSVEIPVGKVRVRITDDSDHLLDETEIDGTVVLYQDSSEEKRVTPQNGFAIFSDIAVGSYYVSVQDNKNRYAAKRSAEFTVNENQQTLITVVLSRSIAQTLTVSVEDRETLFGIADARVALVSKASKQELFSKQTDSAGKAVFSLSDSEDWSVQVSADDYLPDAVDATATSQSLTVQLDKISSDNTGVVTVSVTDEDKKPVENAKVRLRYDDTQTFAPYEAQLTDSNGNVRLTGVKQGDKLFAYAEKFPASGASSPAVIALTPENHFDVALVVGNTTLRISASTEDGERIPSSTAELFDADGSSLGEIPLSDGTGSTTLKADKRVFLVIRNDSYFSYQTETYQLFKDTTITIDAKLPSRLVSGGPRVSLVGVFNEQGEKVDQMEAGNNYLVRLQLKIPEDAQYGEAGVHFRVGNQAVTENDSIVIKSVNVANAVIVAGTTFNPPRGQIVDLNPANTSFGDAKWANVAWNNPVSQVYTLAFLVRVKNSAPLSAPIPMYYRAWANGSDSRVLRDPLDNELGESHQISTKQDLYANAYPVSRYFEGTGSECDSYFCYSNVRVFDNTQGLYIPSPFSLVINRDYNFSFSIQNASPVNLTGGKLVISTLTDSKETTDLVVSRYEIKNASAQAFLGTTLTDGHGEFDVGSLVVNAGITGSITFRPTKTIPSAIRLQTVYNGETVSTKEIPLDVTAGKKILITLDPDVLPAFIDVPATVTLTEEGNLEPVQDAQVTLTRQTVDRAKTAMQKNSNGLGKADFVIPASTPATRIIVEALKTDYTSEPLVRMVDDNVLVFEPSTLAFALKSPSTPETSVKVKIENRTKTDLRLSNLQLVGDFAGVLDAQKISGWLETLKGTTIPAGAQKEIELRVFLSPTAMLFANTTIDASLAVQAVDSKLAAKWVFSVPAKISVQLDGVPENESCLSIDEPKWQTSSLEGNLQYAFTLTNNCTVAGKPLRLTNLASQIKWSTNAIGNVELSLTDASNPNNAIHQVLREDNWVSLFDSVPADATYYGVLSFVPKNGKTGQSAKFTVDFAGETQTENGTKKLNTKEPITADLLITNLRSCIQYSTSGGGPSNLAQLPSTQQPANVPETQTENTSANTPTANAQGPNSGILVSLQAIPSGSGTGSTPTSDAEFTTVKVGTAMDAKLTIDMSNCGALPIDFVLCKGDDYCRGGTADGGITVKPTEFSLSPDKPVREITITRQEVPGIYGLTIFARTQGGVYNPVATIDVTVDPKTDTEYFTLSKYILLIKGIGTQDSAYLVNTNFVTSTTVQAAASDWAKKKPPAQNGMGSMLPLLGLAMAPQMMQGLIGPMQGAFDGASKLANNSDKALATYQNTYNTAKNDTTSLQSKFTKDAGPAGDFGKLNNLDPKDTSSLKTQCTSA